jgi:hypothetical protein
MNKLVQLPLTPYINTQKIKEVYFQDNLILLNNGNSISISEHYKTKFIKEHHVFKK